MRIIGPPYYKPEGTCLAAGIAKAAYEQRMAEERKRRLENARRKYEARLRCPECGDGLKIRHRGPSGYYWACRHCLGEMVVP